MIFRSTVLPYSTLKAGRGRKARTTIAILEDYLPAPLKKYNLLNVGELGRNY